MLVRNVSYIFIALCVISSCVSAPPADDDLPLLTQARIKNMMHNMPDVSNADIKNIHLHASAARNGIQNGCMECRYAGPPFLAHIWPTSRSYHLVLKNCYNLSIGNATDVNQIPMSRRQRSLEYMICAHEMGHYDRRNTAMWSRRIAALGMWAAVGGIYAYAWNRMCEPHASCVFGEMSSVGLQTATSTIFSAFTCAFLQKLCNPLRLLLFGYDYYEEWQADNFALRQATNDNQLCAYQAYFQVIAQYDPTPWYKKIFDPHPSPHTRANNVQKYRKARNNKLREVQKYRKECNEACRERRSRLAKMHRHMDI